MKNKALQKKIQDVTFDPKIVRVAWERECNLLEARIAELEKIPGFMIDFFDKYGHYPSDRVIRELFKIK